MKLDYRALAAVAVGGGVGSIVRYGLNAFIQSRPGADFPLGTMVINISGSFLLGFIMRFSLETAVISPEIRLLLTTGFCGGFTTFSTFSYESIQLLEQGEYGKAGTYVFGSVFLSLVGTFLGIGLARKVITMRAERPRADS